MLAPRGDHFRRLSEEWQPRRGSVAPRMDAVGEEDEDGLAAREKEGRGAGEAEVADRAEALQGGEEGGVAQAPAEAEVP